tara:strand:+ start:4747 stop:5022 length:276 start_codon:yes stop_codon:yes gene_type:complete
MSKSEETLAHMTIDNYERMLDYCKFIKESFAKILEASTEMGPDEADPELVKWCAEQIEIINDLIERDRVRDEVVNSLVEGAVKDLEPPTMN